MPSAVSQAAPVVADADSSVSSATASTTQSSIPATSAEGGQVTTAAAAPPSSGVVRSGSVSSGSQAVNKARLKTGKKASQKDARPARLTWDSVVDGILNCRLWSRGQTVSFQFNLTEKPDEIANNLVNYISHD